MKYLIGLLLFLFLVFGRSALAAELQPEVAAAKEARLYIEFQSMNL